MMNNENDRELDLELTDKTILITGFGGFIATHLFCHLLTNNPKNKYILLSHNQQPDYYVYTVLEKIYKLDPISDYPNITLRIGDIQSKKFLQSIFSNHAIDIVIHLAAQSIVSVSERFPTETIKTNILATQYLLELIVNENEYHKRDCYLIYQSTDKVYGNKELATLDSPLEPVDFYGITKTSADMFVQFYQKKFPDLFYILRPCNIIGYDLNLSRLIPDIITTCLKGKNPKIQSFLNEKFPKRQFIYINDYNNIVEKLLISFKNNNSYESEFDNILNIGTHLIYNTFEIASLIITKIILLIPDKKYKLEFKAPVSHLEIYNQSLDYIINDKNIKYKSIDTILDLIVHQYITYYKL